MEVIQSKSNHRIKEAKKLYQKKYRTTSYLIEGWHLLEEAIKSDAAIETVFTTTEKADKLPHHLEDKVVLVTPDVLEVLSDSPTPQGVVAQIAQTKRACALGEGLVLVLEDIQDPGNLGTMVRTAHAAGCQAVFLTDTSVDSYNSKALRSMQGSHFHIPIYRMPISLILKTLKTANFQLLATVLSDDSTDYRQLRRDGRQAIIMGNEGKGITQETARAADSRLHIPMPGGAESLNVAVACGIVLFALSN